MLKNTSKQFGLASIALHWSMAILLIGLFLAGLYMTNLNYYDPWYHKAPWWHKSFGLLTLFLLIIRLFWTLSNPAPKALQTHKKWEVSLAKIIQKTLYLLILLITISGYLIATAKGKGIDFFNWFVLPSITKEINEEIADLIGNAHLIMALILASLVVLHTFAALKHHFIDKDETLKRMINK